MDSKLIYQSPFSNFEIIILANNPKFNEDFTNDQLFGLLPIANKPILQQILEQFFRLHFTKIILVCLDKDESLYADFLFSYFKMDDPSTKVKLFSVDETQTTCEIIRKVTASNLSHQFEETSSNPNNHIIVYPINLIMSIILTAAVDFHIENSSMITIIASREEQGISDKEYKTAPSHLFRNTKTPQISGKRLLVYNETNPKQLVELLSDSQSIKNDIDLQLKSGHLSETAFQTNASSVQQNSEKDGFLKNYNDDDDNLDKSSSKFEEEIEFSINASMKVSSFNLKRYRSLVVDPSISLTNAYLLSPECIQFLFDQKNIHSIESELIPIICSQKVEKKTLRASIFLTNEKVFAFKVTDFASLYVANMRCAASNLVGFSPNADLIHIDTTKQDDDEPNDIDENEDINKDIENFNNTLKAYYKEDPLTLPEKFKYFSGNVYGAYLIVQSNTSIIKKSVIGRHCKIGKRVKIINSILFDHVTVDDGAKLMNCIVGPNSVVKKNSNLKQRIIMTGSGSSQNLESDKLLVQFGEK